MSFLKKTQSKYVVAAGKSESFKTPIGKYVVSYESGSGDRQVWTVRDSQGHIVGDGYGATALDGLKAYLSSRGMDDKKLAQIVTAGEIIPFPSHLARKPAPAPIKANPANDKKLVAQLQKLLMSEHVSLCDSSTCDINFAAECGYYKWAIELFAGCGAASKKFDELYGQLSPAFKKDAEAERKEMVKEPHKECPHCNAVTWGEDIDQCDSCLKAL